MSYQSEAELEKLLVQQLYLHNKSKLWEVKFSYKEFQRVLRKIEGKSVFQSAKILRDKFILDRDDGSEVYIGLFDSKQWC